jgi:ATP-dependent DNA helicase RecG
MLDIILEAIKNSLRSDQVSDQVTDQVKNLVAILINGENDASELMRILDLSHRPTFRKNYLRPALEAHLIEMTDPQSKSSPMQKYRITDAGVRLWNAIKVKKKAKKPGMKK